MSLADLTARAVRRAIAEFDRIGRDAFLRKYRFGTARGYLLKGKKGKVYDSKAIAGVAHGYLPRRRPLDNLEFSGGAATVQKVLQKLGFKVGGPKSSKRPTTVRQVRKFMEAQERIARRLSTRKLRQRAQRAKKRPDSRKVTARMYVRNAAVAEYAKRLAKGRCDLCRRRAPFRILGKRAYLECHHITWLARGGEDTIGNTVALCPNCHRKMHLLNLKSDRLMLKGRVSQRLVR